MRWETYGHASGVDHFAWWCERNIFQQTAPFAGQPLVLEPWQLEFMGEALAVGEDLRQLWRAVALIVSRKNGKTALMAAYALYHLLNTEGRPEVLVAAASDKNARRLFDAIIGYVRANQSLIDQLHVRDYIGEIVRRDGGGVIFRLAADPTTLHGYNPSLVVADEVHGWTKPYHRKVWTALTTAGGAREDSDEGTQVFTITTAGEAAQRATSILGVMLDANEAAGELDSDTSGLTVSRNWPGRTLIYNYSAPTLDHTDVQALKLANPSSWITAEGYLSRQASATDLSPSEVLQFHGCVWAVGESTWLDPIVFAALADPREVKRDTPVVLAFDGSYNRDSTVLVGATIEEHPYVWVQAAWERPPDAPATWRVNRLDVRGAIDDAMEFYDVRELAPDPPGWEADIDELEARYGEVVVRFDTDQPRRMGPAADVFVQAVLGPGGTDELLPDDLADDPARAQGDTFEPELRHDGSEILTRHLSNCVPVRRSSYTLPSKEANDSPRKIDAAIGAIIAYYRAKWLYTNQSDDLVAIVVDTEPPRDQRRRMQRPSGR